MKERVEACGEGSPECRKIGSVFFLFGNFYAISQTVEERGIFGRRMLTFSFAFSIPAFDMIFDLGELVLIVGMDRRGIEWNEFASNHQTLFKYKLFPFTEWQQVALVLDRFFLVLFTAGTLIVLRLTVFSDQSTKALFGD